MNEYETIFIVEPKSVDAQRDELNNRFEGIIKKHKGGRLYNRFLGRRRLAYQIRKLKEGYYYALNYVANPTVVEELEKSMRYDEAILRFLTVKKNEEVDYEKRLAEVKAKNEENAPLDAKGMKFEIYEEDEDEEE